MSEDEAKPIDSCDCGTKVKKCIFFFPCNEIIMASCDMSTHALVSGMCGSSKESLSVVCYRRFHENIYILTSSNFHLAGLFPILNITIGLQVREAPYIVS